MNMEGGAKTPQLQAVLAGADDNVNECLAIVMEIRNRLMPTQPSTCAGESTEEASLLSFTERLSAKTTNLAAALKEIAEVI